MMSIFSNPTSVRSISRGFRSMNRSLLMIAGLAAIGFSCGKNNDTTEFGDWTRKSDFEGVARGGAASFVIGTKAYVATGLNSNSERLSDMWEYDSQLNTWTQKANFPGVARALGSGFTANNKGYVGLGQNANNQYLKDFYSYDPTANKWTKIADYMGSARSGSVSFVINNKGYVGTGYDGNYVNDIYSYDPAADAWTKETSYAGVKRRGAVSMVINNVAYVGTGENNGSSQRDWWVYDPATKVWTQKLDFTSDQSTIARRNASTFVIGNIGYLLMGEGGDSFVWSYDPATDIWTKVQDISTGSWKVKPSIRSLAVSFSINNIGYITTGGSSTRYDDIYAFDPSKQRVVAE
ncbi:N-acetylneuraminic acid mutarotase [Siphonobacter sp. BAB-5404]|nr:N-acetylneuraminic acid mutarotase [Siphonobacter sp. SORGH_AS_0500]